MLDETVQTLLIEDNAEHARLIAQHVAQSEPLHFALNIETTLGAALARLCLGGMHLVLVDLTLSDSSGLETFLRVAEAAPDLPIVVLSGLQDVALAIETVRLGAQDYLVKGRFDHLLLNRALQYAVERKRVQLQLKRNNEDLERRVADRTAALLDMNIRLQQEVAERKKAEESVVESNRSLADALTRLEATQDQVIRRERMHALGRMAHGMAHDFNNALAPILGFTELLLMKPELLADQEKVRGYLEMILTAAKESERVTSRLREFSRYRDANEYIASVVINDLVLQAISITQPRWKDQALAAGINIEIRTELGNVPTVPGNEQELRELLVSLIFNSVDAIVKRGAVTIRTAVQGRWLTLTVADDGVGMSEEVRAHCLEPFFSTKEEEGNGLGLGSVYGIVRRHEGQLDIQSELGRGTAVTVSLPLDRNVRAPEAPKLEKASSGPLHILVVEDEPLVREVIGVYLEEDNHTVTLAENGRDGLDKFKAGKFDLVLTDRAMPEMNGDELAVEIRKLNPAQPVVLLTGFGDLMAGAGEKPAGVDLVVSKPFNLTTLRNALATATGR
jgi:signal transduction histidine kinase